VGSLNCVLAAKKKLKSEASSQASKMDLSSLADALSKINFDDDFVGEQVVAIITEMSLVAEDGSNTLSYKPPTNNNVLIKLISERLLSYFPDICIKIIDCILLIDWS
jgi:hypothetical protein